jgi:hypothetical protein
MEALSISNEKVQLVNPKAGHDVRAHSKIRLIDHWTFPLTGSS